MRFSLIGLLALPLLATAAPNPWQVQVSIEEDAVQSAASLEPVEPVVKMGNRVVTPLSKKIPTFDDHRIKHHKDKVLLGRIREFFKTFTTGDFDGMRDLQSESYNMTDIPIAAIRLSRDQWYETNKNFVSLMEDLRVIALTLHGSSKPGSFSILEHIVWFKLTKMPPPPAIPHLPQGAKPGDTVGMINLSVLFWDEEGLISQELEYGRLTWQAFDEHAFDPVASFLEANGYGNRGIEL